MANPPLGMSYHTIDRSGRKDAVTPDAAVSLGRAVAATVSFDENVGRAAGRIADEVSAGCDEQCAARAAGIVIDVDVATRLLSDYLRAWEWPAILRLTSGLHPAALDGDRAERDRLHWIWRSAHELALQFAEEDDEPDADWSAPEAAAAFRRLAQVEAAAGRTDVAVACALSAVNLAGGSLESRPSADVALMLLRDVGDPGLSIALAASAADALAQRSRTDPSVVLDAFEACESILRLAPMAGDTGAEAARRIKAVVLGTQPLRGLVPLGNATQVTAGGDLRDGSALFTSPLWDVTASEARSHLQALFTWAVLHENQRLAHLPQDEDSVAEAKWATWSFDYPPFRHAVPHGLSLRRKRGLDEILLVLAHETVHVLSMVGELGLASAALRLALLDTELQLWTFVGPVDPDSTRLVGAAPLPEDEIIALPQAEQALELTRKLQMLQDVWAPWLEGLALFGEMGATAPGDPFDTHVTQVLSNLWDEESLIAQAEREGIDVATAATRRQLEGNTAFIAAGRAAGPARLRDLLETHPATYLAGYLAVRGVVARWREASAGDLDAPSAYRLLMHTTRFGTLSAVPDLALPADRFREEAIAGLLTWVRRIAAIDPRWFVGFQDPEAAKKTWSWDVVDDRLCLQELARDSNEIVLPLLDRALRTLAGDDADLERIATRDDTTRAFIAACADALRRRLEAVDDDADEALARRMIGRAAVMPLGQCRSLFWLTADNALVCLIRVTPGPAADEDTRHQLIEEQLDDDEADALRREMLARFDSRIDVIRIADLAEMRPPPEFRGGGANLLAYVYGSWTKITYRGVHLGARSPVSESLVAAARARLLPDPVLDIESGHTATGIKGAERTAAWIARSARWALDGAPCNPSALVDHVESLAQEVADLKGHTERDDAGEALLSLIVPAGMAEQLQATGLSSPRSARRGFPGAVISALAETVVAPAENAFLDRHHAAVTQQIGPIFEHSPRGWDVRAIREEGR